MSTYSSRTVAWLAIRLRVLERDGYVCQYCGAAATTVDHLTPKLRGGEDVMENLVAACKPCNSRKGTKTRIRASWSDKAWFA